MILPKADIGRGFFSFNGAVFFLFNIWSFAKSPKRIPRKSSKAFGYLTTALNRSKISIFSKVSLVYVGTTICRSGESNARKKLKKTQKRCLPDFLVWLLAQCFVWFGELRPRQTSRWLSWRCTFGFFRSVIHIL